MGRKIFARDPPCTHFRTGMKVRKTSRFSKTLEREHCRIQDHSSIPWIKSQEEMKEKELLVQRKIADIKYLGVLGF